MFIFGALQPLMDTNLSTIRYNPKLILVRLVNGEKISTSGNSDGLGLVTLAVNLNQAEEIQARMSTGNLQLLASI